MFYVESSEPMKVKLSQFVDKCGGIENAAMLLNTSPNNLYRWLRGERSYSYNLCAKIAEKLDVNIWKMLDGENIKSMTINTFCRINKQISEEESNILGWLLTDGNMGGKDGSLSISQKNKEVLENLSTSIESNFQIKDKTYFNRDRLSWKLTIGPRAIKYYFNLRYGVPLGKKSNIIRVPSEFCKCDRNIKLSFLTGCFEGDGSFSFYTRLNKNNDSYYVPRVNLSSNSLHFLEDILKMLSGMGYECKIYKDRTGYKLSIMKINQCIRFYFEIMPFMIHHEKISDLQRSISNKQILNVIRIDNCGELLDKFKRTVNKAWSEMAFEFNTFNSFDDNTIRNWSYDCFPMPLSVVVWLCDRLNKNYFDYIPKEFSVVLWAHNKITTEEFNTIVGDKELKKKKVLLKNMKTGKEQLISPKDLSKKLK